MRHYCNRLGTAQALEKLGLKLIDRDRPKVKKQRAAMNDGVAAFLAALAPKVADQLAAHLGMVQKELKPGDALAIAARRAREALDALDLADEWLALISVAEKPLTALAIDGALEALGQVGIAQDDIVTLAGDRAGAWGRTRAAEMVGMRRNDQGDLVPNPSAKWRIDDTTRDMLRGTVDEALVEGWSADELKAAILKDHAFSPERAESIARTEMAKADMAGTMEGYRASGVVVGKEWSTSQDDKVSDECNSCEAAGAIGLDDKFPTGEDAPPNHPGCRCTVLPVLDTDKPAPTGEKTTKDTNMTKLYAAIEKAEKQDDGTIKVYGFASAEVVDSDGETVTADAMKAARAGYMAFANVREMHDPKKAAGVAIEYDVQDDGRTWFGAHVVDPVAVLKVETGVYKGFSIGARVPAGGRDGKVIKSIDLREVSLVDRPANPEAVFTMFKADDVAKGMYDVSSFAQCLYSISNIVAGAGWEAQGEGDNSPVPAALMAWLKTGLGIFQSMAAEEAAELMESLAAAVPAAAETVTLADASADLIKAGARFSTATKAALKGAHEACKAADAALAALNYETEPDGDEPSKADDSAELTKVAADEAAQITDIAKAAGLTLPEPTATALTKAALTELVTLRKTHADLLASPAAVRGAIKTVVIGKQADRSGEERETTPVVKHDGEVNEFATLVKAAQARPIRIT